jgi:hypothetical protein
MVIVFSQAGVRYLSLSPAMTSFRRVCARNRSVHARTPSASRYRPLTVTGSDPSSLAGQHVEVAWPRAVHNGLHREVRGIDDVE